VPHGRHRARAEIYGDQNRSNVRHDTLSRPRSRAEGGALHPLLVLRDVRML
jgi:hypothetical protein